MGLLSEIVRNVLVIVLVASFLELIMPEGTLRPFVRFAIGLFILVAVLNPIAGALFADKDLEIQWWDSQSHLEKQEEQILRTGQEINQQIWDNNQELLASKVEGQISAVAILVPGVDDVETKVQLDGTGSLDSLNLVVKPQSNAARDAEGRVGAFSGNTAGAGAQEQEEIRRKLTSVIRNLYGLENVSIEIEFEGS